MLIFRFFNIAPEDIFLFFKNLFNYIFNYNNQVQFVLSILAFIGISGFIPFIRFFDTHIFNKRISKLMRRLGKYIRQLVYAE
jgi:hypothetical protein